MKPFTTYHWTKLSHDDQIDKSQLTFETMDMRRSIRHFSDKKVAREAILNAIRTASTAPSGANKQPWTFCLVSSQKLKEKIRFAAEKEEKLNYGGRMSETWLNDLKKFGTDWQKPFLETAPFLIAVFKKAYDEEDGEKMTNYYVNESIGIATGFLLMSLHLAGIHALTHTPSPMNFLGKLLNRPSNERAFLLIPVGYPSNDCKVPNIRRKALDEILVEYS